jgi:hypothetical protein
MFTGRIVGRNDRRGIGVAARRVAAFASAARWDACMFAERTPIAIFAGSTPLAAHFLSLRRIAYQSACVFHK